MTGKALAELGLEPICAQAYVGGLGIAKALRQGAQIVICGRVADAAPASEFFLILILIVLSLSRSSLRVTQCLRIEDNKANYFHPISLWTWLDIISFAVGPGKVLTVYSRCFSASPHTFLSGRC